MLSKDVLIEDRISSLIESQFPSFYREEGPLFVLFVRKYYEWMESQGQALYHSRRVPSYKDIDQTTDEFLVYFKEKYLSGIQLETESNSRTLVKRSLDLYRSKGTERSVDLLFRTVFGTGAKVSYPKDMMFKSSDGEWRRPRYVEVTNSGLDRFYGYQVQGETSGARAFVERIVKRRTEFKTVYSLYVSDVRGAFQPGERINRTSDPLESSTCPIVVGSLSEILVDQGGSGHFVGETLPIVSQRGVGGLARVTEVTDLTGSVSAELINGGWGYTDDLELLVSNTVATVVSSGTPPYLTDHSVSYVSTLDTVSQSLLTINYDSLTGNLERGDVFLLKNSSSANVGSAIVIGVDESNATSGVLYASTLEYHDNVSISTLASSLDSIDLIEGSGNAAVSSANGSISSARIVGLSPRLDLSLSGVVGDFVVGETVSQSLASGVVRSIAVDSGGVGTMILEDFSGSFFASADPIVGSASGALASVTSHTLLVGLDSIQGTLQIDSETTYLVSKETGPLGLVSALSSGEGLLVSVSPELGDTEVVPLSLEQLADYLSVELDAVSYGFPSNPTANASSIIADCLEITNVTMGSVTGIIVSGTGQDYNVPPIVRVVDASVRSFDKRGYTVVVANQTSTFQVGEILTQQSTGARAYVTSISPDRTVMELGRRSWADLLPTTDANSAVVGSITGTTASVLSVVDGYTASRYPDYDLIGFDSIVDTQSLISEGSISRLEVTDSGHGFEQSEQVSFGGGTGRVVLAGVGESQGFYARAGSSPSGNKRIRDGHFYQEYSYVVGSSVPIDRYSDMLKTVVHAAGTRFFGSYEHETILDSSAQVSSSIAIEE